MPKCVWLTTRRGKPADYLLEEYNPAVEQILHVQLTGMVGRSIREPGFLISEEIWTDLYETVNQADSRFE